jgi:hypothetical protein
LLGRQNTKKLKKGKEQASKKKEKQRLRVAIALTTKR